MAGPGTGGGQVGTPVDIGANGNGVTGDNRPSDFTGDQAITGLFNCDTPGHGLQAVLAYEQSTGTGQILFGTGDGSPIPAQESGWEQDLYQVTDPNGSIPQQLVNAGNTSGLSEPFPDLLGIAGNTLTLYSSAVCGDYGDDVDAAGIDVSATTSPDGTLDWDSWQIASTQLASGTAMYLWNPSTGALYLWENLAYNVSGSDLSYTQYVIADGTTATWNKGASLTLAAADMTGSGVPDLWTVGNGGTATAYLATLDSGMATLAAQPAQTLLVPGHDWPLNDATSGTVTTAADTTGSPSLDAAGSGGASWNDSDPMFNPDVSLDGSTGKLAATGPALTPSKGFTVSVWAYPTSLGPIVVSQDMTQASSFKIFSDGGTGEWAFCMATADSTSAGYDCVEGGTVALDAWVHLTVTYQASSQTMSLYIDGTKVATGTHKPLTGVTNGAFQIGDRIASAGSYTKYFAGQLADVQVWASVVTP
jgi:hypothetical protein